MWMLKGHLLIFFIIHVSESSYVMDAVYHAGEELLKFYSMLNKSNLTSFDNPKTVQRLLGNDHQANEKIRDKIYDINEKLREIEDSINTETRNNLFRLVRSTAIALKCVDEMDIFIESITYAYENFYRIVIRDRYNYNRELDNLPTFFPDIKSNIEMIRKIMTQPIQLLPGESGLIGAINNFAKTHYKEICNSYQSIDDILIYLFKAAILAEMKTSIMGPFANLYKYRNNEDRKIFNTLAKTQFQRYFEWYVSIIQRNLNLTTGLYMRACDPTNGTWIMDETYYEFDGISQGMIFRYQPTGCLLKSCRNIWQRRAIQCDARYYDTRSRCSSTPTDCENLGTVQACVLNSGPHRFQYVNSSILGFYGSNSNCPKDDGYIIDNLSGTHAGYATCGCHCDTSHYKISLMLMESPRDSNKVIIGLRFKRKDKILHIQPRVGKLIANGYIQQNSESWLQIPTAIDPSQTHSIDKENSYFFLDDVLLPSKFVLSGVKFNKVTRGAVTGFAIEIFGIPFDYRNGQLDPPGIIQLSSSSSDSGLPLLFDAISSLQTKEANIPSSPDRKYVQLEQSHLRSDFGQSVLPLFDAVPVTTNPSSALGGLGIFHKGVQGYAGFISLRTYGIRHLQYFENFTYAHTIEG